MRWSAPFAAVVLLLSSGAPCFPAPRQEPVPSPSPYAPKYLEQMTLRYADPAVVAKSLNARVLPEGVFRVQPDPKNPRALRVLATQEGIETVRALIALIDVKPRQGTFRVTVERVRFMANGKKYAVPVTRKTLTLTHNVKSAFRLVDTTGATVVAAVTVRLPQTKDTPETLLAELGCREAKGRTVGLERGLALPTGAKPTRVVGITFAEESNIIGTVGVGNTPAKWTGTFTAYYLTIQTISVSR